MPVCQIMQLLHFFSEWSDLGHCGDVHSWEDGQLSCSMCVRTLILGLGIVDMILEF